MKDTRVMETWALAALFLFLLVLAVLPSLGLGELGSRWEPAEDGWRYVRLDGSYPVNDWLTIRGVWYHVDGEGRRQTGWLSQGDRWYYLDETGAMATGWREIDGDWYYLDADGVMRTGWLQRDGYWFYLDGDGVMLTGWQEIDGDYYFFGPSGAMAQSQFIEGFYFDENGVWQP